MITTIMEQAKGRVTILKQEPEKRKEYLQNFANFMLILFISYVLYNFFSYGYKLLHGGKNKNLTKKRHYKNKNSNYISSC